MFAQFKIANDCVNYIQVCDNSTISLNPSGIGNLQEISGHGCNSSEHNSLWLKFTIKTSGTLGFDLIPESTDLYEDYDFWVFGPNADCSNLGASIRCSTTNPLASGAFNNHTGMRDSEPNNDFYEGPGDNGDNYIKSLNVTAGETYFLVIDRPIGNSKFSLNWTGTATLLNPFQNVVFNAPQPIKICNNLTSFDFSTLSSFILNGNTDFIVTYFDNYDDANYNQNPLASPYLISEKNYYYRIQNTKSECYSVGIIPVIKNPINTKTGETFACTKGNMTGDFDLTKASISNDNNITTIKYYENYNPANTTFSDPIINFTSYNSVEKTVYAYLENSLGCKAVSEILLKLYPIPNFNTINFNSTLCDLDFDGNYSVTFSKDVSPVVVNGYQNFNISYYLNSSYTGSPLPDNWSYSTPTRVYVLVDSKNGCTNATGYIDFKIGNKISVNNYSIAICDDDLDGKIDLKMGDYNGYVSTSSTATFKYFLTQADAINNTNAITNLSQTLTKTTTYYVRTEDATKGCPNWSMLVINFTQPLSSSVLKDKVICPNTTTVMDAGTGFTGYKWSNGATTQTATYGLGNHYVDLSSNGCVYRQNFKITESVDPVINSIIVDGNNITVNVSGGNQPYYYSLDGINYQTSNIFNSLQRGLQKVYVQAAERCIPIEKEFLIINLINAITPNGDGINDVLDYSDLKIKKDVKILIFDRFGNIIFKKVNSDNYYWDGKQNGRTIPSGTYWYVLEWIEPDTGIKINFKGWILLKNRN